MTRLTKACALALVLIAALPRMATAQQGTMLCAERAAVLAQLNGRYGEQVRGIGLAPNNRIVEVFVSEETGTWTITVTSADGTTCLMAAGQYFEDMLPVAPGENL
jgi:hypothetical protein